MCQHLKASGICISHLLRLYVKVVRNLYVCEVKMAVAQLASVNLLRTCSARVVCLTLNVLNVTHEFICENIPW